uniref:Uncharacterized protein n=1 Tax=viral metagenome TaxID=1070528 RepID=A0A6C0F754_9ZZZZ
MKILKNTFTTLVSTMPQKTHSEQRSILQTLLSHNYKILETYPPQSHKYKRAIHHICLLESVTNKH